MPGKRWRGLGPAQYAGLLRADFASFAQHVFAELYPKTRFQMNWHLWVIAARLAAVRAGKLRRLAIHLPPRHLESLLASVAFPAWVLGHDPSAEILCVSYAQDLADKWSHDCRRIMLSPWYRRCSRPASRRALRRWPNSRRRQMAAASPPRWAAC